MKKFNNKLYQGKARLYSELKQYPRISKLWVWNEIKMSYEPPERGKAYLARKYSEDRKRLTAYFETLEEAKLWQSTRSAPFITSAVVLPSTKDGTCFANVVTEWKKRKYPTLAESTRDQYDKLLELYFKPLVTIEIESFTPNVIDQWIDYLKEPKNGFVLSSSRKRFDHELSLLCTILTYYCEYHDDTKLRYPIKRRHREAIQLKKDYIVRPKDFTEEEFLRFREKLLPLKRGNILFNLATVQYYQALRISEAAAIHWEDIRLDFNNPVSSRIKISKSIFWGRTKANNQPKVMNGFKNSRSNQGTKEQPLMPATFEILKSMHQINLHGMAFTDVGGEILCYKNIKAAYNRAFKLAGLPYTATHVLRHGMTRKVYNDTGDLAIAGQLLGNSTQDSIQVYAKRSTNALNEYTQKQWDKHNELGRNWSQSPEVNENA